MGAVDTPTAQRPGSVIHDAIGEVQQDSPTAAAPPSVSAASGEASFARLKDTRAQASGGRASSALRDGHHRSASAADTRRGHGGIPADYDPAWRTEFLTARADGSNQSKTRPTSGRLQDRSAAQRPQVRAPVAATGRWMGKARLIRGAAASRVGIQRARREGTYVRLRAGDPGGQALIQGGTPTNIRQGADRPRFCRPLNRGACLIARWSSMWTTPYGDYEHLARVKEWAASGGESESKSRWAVMTRPIIPPRCDNHKPAPPS